VAANSPDELNAKLTRRVQSRTRGQLTGWLTIALSGCLRHAEEFAEYDDEDSLGELNLALGTINAVVDELTARKAAQNEEDSSR
jgi:hypothetical protein